MKIEGIIWLEAIVEKLAVKRHITPEEVEEVLSIRPKFRFIEAGDREAEDVYMALGQTDVG